ncbi:MAG: hypothetical protein KDB07_06875, partial [Planctomycetes bacterium]|nr:hypothetical protein [Planctomycetota bacterium]
MDDATPQDTNRARTPRSREGKIAIAAIGGFVMLCVAMFAWMSLIAPNTLYEGLQKQFQAGNYDHVVARIDAQADGPEGVQG